MLRRTFIRIEKRDVDSARKEWELLKSEYPQGVDVQPAIEFMHARMLTAKILSKG